ncbi:MAG: trehalase family glycosidase [Verrucomicrobiota bacterium]
MTKLRTLLGALLLGLMVPGLLSADDATPPSPNPARSAVHADRAKFPDPVFGKEPGYVELYWKACDLATAHVLSQPGLPQSPYMDEAFWDDTIWIWDACFMSLYCRYAPGALPGIESLSNFYAPIHDGASMTLTAPFDGQANFHVVIQHPDNPPLFAWAEWQSFQMTGDVARIKWLLEDKQYLQKHYQWFNALKRGETFPWARIPAGLSPQALGFQWTGVASGMDNSPRFESKDVLAVDALAQQGLAARTIARLAEVIHDEPLAAQYRQEYERVRDLVNSHYWDEADGFYYDLMPDGKTFSRVRTPASFWPVLAGMAVPQRIARMVDAVRDPSDLGGAVPWVSVSRSDKDFNGATGDYWRGSVWLPTAYMGIRALTENGQGDLADETAETVLHRMYITYRDYDPHTIWECYNPNRPEPAMHGNDRVRPDFCGWSALGPISLFIENVIGIHSVDATRRVVEWHLHQPGRNGLRNFHFGDVTTDFVANGGGFVDVTSNHAYTLVVNGTALDVKPGSQRFVVPVSTGGQ